MGKTLYGYVVKENVEYEWKSEPGACEVCQGMSGVVYDSANDIPDRPHPNCKCWIDILEKEIEEAITDPIEIRREQFKDKKRNELELEKLLGDAKSLEQEIDEYVRQVNQQENELEQIESSVENSKLDSKEQQKLSDLKETIDFGKYKGDKAKQDIAILQNQISKSGGSPQDVSRLKQELEKLNKVKEDIAVKCGATWNALIYGKYHSKRYDMPESYDLFKIAVDKKTHNNDYVKKNGKLYDSIDDLHNDKLSKDIKSRIAQESQQKDCKVLVLNSNSSVAQKIQQSDALREFLTKNMESIRKTGTAPNTMIEFKDIDKDLYSTFHGAEVKNIRLDNQGNLNIRVEDYYNFNPNRTSVKGRVGEKLQKQGDLEPYYVITVLKIPKEVWQNYKVH